MSEPRQVKTIQDAVRESMLHAGETVEVELDRSSQPLARLAAFLRTTGEFGDGEDVVDAAIRLLSRHYGATV